MQRFEFRIISLPPGQYTATLNEYGAEGWDLVTVAHDVRTVPAPRESSGGLPMPSGLGKLGQAAEAVSKLGESDTNNEPEPGSVTTTLLWVLRRPLHDDL
ncbi:MAG TPA: hypothetical protein VLK36_06470 [Gaiellaceae bacterium]|nr:hypothetical protein [Gaiellaceae bacterium]